MTSWWQAFGAGLSIGLSLGGFIQWLVTRKEAP